MNNTVKYEADETLFAGHQFSQPRKLLFSLNLCFLKLQKKKIIIIEPLFENYNFENTMQFQKLIQH